MISLLINYQVTVEGRQQHLSAVCMVCLISINESDHLFIILKFFFLALHCIASHRMALIAVVP